MLVRGPAGHGKTVALADFWRSARVAGRRIAWLGLTAADADVAVLRARLADSLASLDGSQVDRHGGRAGRVPSSPELAARQLCATHSAALDGATLVLDGFETLEDTESVAMIASLIDWAEHTTFVLGTRRTAQLPFAALRAQGRAAEIGPAELTFRLDEARELADATVPDEYLLLLLQRCDGIALAVDLAIRALLTPRSACDASSCESWVDELAGYFREQVLSGLAPDLRRLLGKLAVVEQFDVSLASALCGREVGQQVRELYRERSLIARDRSTGLFHLPAALRVCLEGEHQWDDAEELARVHRRAADWFARRALPHEAAMHALLSRDPSLTTRYFDPIGSTTLGARLGMQPIYEALCADADGSSRPGFALVQDMVYAPAAPSTVAADTLAESRLLGLETVPVVEPERLITAAFVRGYRDEPLSEPELLALRDLALRPAVPDVATRGLARNLLCWEGLRSGRLGASALWADLAEHDFLATGAVYANAFIHLLRVPVLIWHNDLAGATRQAELARIVAQLFHPDDPRLENLSQLMASWVGHEQGRPLPVDPARELARELSLGERWHDAVALGFTLAARSAEAADDADGARAILDAGITVADARRQRRAQWSLRCERVRLAIRSGDLVAARDGAAHLGLDATGVSGRAELGLTWREDIEGLEAYVQLSLALSDVPGARLAVASLSSRAREYGLPRIQLLAHRAEADCALASGDGPGAAHARAAAEAVGVTTPAHDAWRSNPPPLHGADPPRLPMEPCDRTDMDPAIAPLTPREAALLELIAAGLSNKQVAWRLKLSEATVKFHIRNIYRKVGARNRVQALVRLRGGVTAPTPAPLEPRD
jgi:LuxR family maltose regulon positive regulatory protein